MSQSRPWDLNIFPWFVKQEQPLISEFFACFDGSLNVNQQQMSFKRALPPQIFNDIRIALWALPFLSIAMHCPFRAYPYLSIASFEHCSLSALIFCVLHSQALLSLLLSLEALPPLEHYPVLIVNNIRIYRIVNPHSSVVQGCSSLKINHRFTLINNPPEIPLNNAVTGGSQAQQQQKLLIAIIDWIK